MQLAVTLRNGKRIALIISAVIAVVVVGVALVVALLLLVTRDTRQDIDLADFTHASDEVPALSGYARDTEELCDNVPGCIQGFRAEHAAYRKFASKEEAAAYASSTADSYLSRWIVIQYTDSSLSDTDRLVIQELIDSTATSE